MLALVHRRCLRADSRSPVARAMQPASRESLLKSAGFQSTHANHRQAERRHMQALPALSSSISGTLKGRTIYAYKDEKAGRSNTYISADKAEIMRRKVVRQLCRQGQS